MNDILQGRKGFCYNLLMMILTLKGNQCKETRKLKSTTTAKVEQCLLCQSTSDRDIVGIALIFPVTTLSLILSPNSTNLFYKSCIFRSRLEKKKELGGTCETSLEEFMSGDAIMLRSLITSPPAGLVPITSANSQLSPELLSFPSPCPQLASPSPQKYSSRQVFHSDAQSCSPVSAACVKMFASIVFSYGCSSISSTQLV